MDKELEDRLDFIEFRQELLFNNGSLNRLLFANRVTRDQYEALIELFNTYYDALNNGEPVNSTNYEIQVGKIVSQCKHIYSFAEEVALGLYEEGDYKEVFEALYGDAIKFQS